MLTPCRLQLRKHRLSSFVSLCGTAITACIKEDRARSLDSHSDRALVGSCHLTVRLDRPGDILDHTQPVGYLGGK